MNQGAFLTDAQFGLVRPYERKTTDAKPDCVAPEYLFTKAYWQHNLQVAVDVNKRMSCYAGVTNPTSEKPDFASVNYPVSGVGRYMLAGVKINTGGLF